MWVTNLVGRYLWTVQVSGTQFCDRPAPFLISHQDIHLEPSTFRLHRENLDFEIVDWNRMDTSTTASIGIYNPQDWW